MQLTIPAQDSKSRGIRLKPSEVREWLHNLPYMDISRTLELVNEQLRVLNRQVIAPAARLQILDEFLVTYQRLAESAPGDESSGDAEQGSLKRLSQNIGFGYKILVHTLVNGEGRFLDSRHLPQAMLGAVHVLGLQITHAHARFQPVPRALWSECMAIYRHARSICREHHAVRLAGNPELTVDAAVRLIALLKLADPYQLRPGMLLALQQYFSTHIELTAIADDADPLTPTVILRLTDAGKRVREDSAGSLGIEIDALLNQMAADIKRLQQQRPATVAGLSRDVTAAALLGGLQQTLQHWETQRERKSIRERTDVGLELVVGLESAWCMINRGRPFDPSLYLGDAHEPIDIGAHSSGQPTAAAQPATAIQCVSIDRNSGGLGICYRGKVRAPQVGQLMAVRRTAQQSGTWVLGVFRWLLEPDSAPGFDAGVQYLAREARPIVIRPLDASGFGGEFQPALSAEQIRGEQRVNTLVLRSKQLQTDDEFNIYHPNGEQQRGRCVELLESGLGFERLIYQLLQE